MIHISLSPNVQAEDFLAALKKLLSPWSWGGNKARQKLAQKLGEFLKKEDVWLFNSGRSSLFVLFKALLEKGDEVVIQSFTCNAVANPVRWADGKPVYVDIDDTFNIDINKLEQAVTQDTRIIVVQHTFGIPARMDKILEIAQRANALVVEDCAHSLGATYKGQKVGTFGDAAIFSFGRDKVISSVYGGALAVNNKKLVPVIKEEAEQVGEAAKSWTAQQLLHPVITYLLLPWYKLGGKYVLVLAQKLKLLSLAVSGKERKGEKPEVFPTKLPDPLAHLAFVQFKKLDALNDHRKKLAKLYENALKGTNFKIVESYGDGSIFLRYPVLHPKAQEIYTAAKKKGIILGRWYSEVIAPAGTDMEAMEYSEGTCEIAEGKAPHILNLPTNIRTSEKDALKILRFLENYV